MEHNELNKLIKKAYYKGYQKAIEEIEEQQTQEKIRKIIEE